MAQVYQMGNTVKGFIRQRHLCAAICKNIVQLIW